MPSPRERHDLMALAKNPTPGTPIYRAHRGNEAESAGIHWTTNPDVAHGFAGHKPAVHEAFIDNPAEQVIPHRALSRIQFSPEGAIKYPQDSNDMGYDWEAEVRLRPGTKVRTAGGGEIPIEHGGRQFYLGLGTHSVPGTKESMRHMTNEAALPHTQGSLFDAVTLRGSERHEAYHPSFDARPGWKEWDEDFSQAHEAVAAKHGLEPFTGTELRELSVTTPPKHKLSMEQFGFGN
jgi:hypothetical protein